MQNTSEYVCKKLIEAFGAGPLKVCTEYHMQITLDKLTHNLFRNELGVLKLQLHGKGRCQVLNDMSAVINRLKQYDARESHVHRSRMALELAEMVSVAKRSMPPDMHEAVFVDAGWRDGIATVGFVHVRRHLHGFTVRAESRPVQIRTIHDAERLAVKFGARASATATVFCDNIAVVNMSQKKYGNRVRAIKRDNNKAADRINNRRGLKQTA